MPAPSLKLLSSAQLILSFAQLLHSSCRSSAVICSSGQQLQQLPAGYADPSDTNQVLMMLRGSHHQGRGGFMSSGAGGDRHDKDEGDGDEEGIVKFCPDR